MDGCESQSKEIGKEQDHIGEVPRGVCAAAHPITQPHPYRFSVEPKVFTPPSCRHTPLPYNLTPEGKRQALNHRNLERAHLLGILDASAEHGYTPTLLLIHDDPCGDDAFGLGENAITVIEEVVDSTLSNVFDTAGCFVVSRPTQTQLIRSQIFDWIEVFFHNTYKPSAPRVQVVITFGCGKDCLTKFQGPKEVLDTILQRLNHYNQVALKHPADQRTDIFV